MSFTATDFEVLRLEKRAPIQQITGPTITSIAELSDVSITDPQEGQVLKLVNGKWTNVDIQAVVSNVVEGTYLAQGTGYTTVFSIPHGFGQQPTNVFIQGTTPEANEDFTISKDETYITITYNFPPPNTGVNNLSYYFRVS